MLTCHASVRVCVSVWWPIFPFPTFGLALNLCNKCVQAHTHTRISKVNTISLGCTMYTSHKSPIDLTCILWPQNSMRLWLCVFVCACECLYEYIWKVKRLFIVSPFILMDLFVCTSHVPLCTTDIFIVIIFSLFLSIYNCALAHCWMCTDFFRLLFYCCCTHHSLNCTTQLASHR